MSPGARFDGKLVDISNIKARHDDQQKAVKEVYARRNGELVQVWSESGDANSLPEGFNPQLDANTTDFDQSSALFRNMAIYGQHLFWVHHEDLRAMDISNPLKPSSVGTVNLASNGGAGIRILSGGQYAFVGDGHSSAEDQKIRVIDISDPANMVEVGMLDHPDLERPHGLALGPNEDCLYVSAYGPANDGTGAQKMTAVDISEPTNPVFASSVDWPGAHDLAIRSDGQYAFGSSHDSAMDVFDISDPTNVSHVHRIDYSNLWNGAGARLSNDENYFFFGAGDSPGYLISIDVSDPENPVEASRAAHSRPYRFRIKDGVLWSANVQYDYGDTWDVSDPEDVSYISEVGNQRLIEMETHPTERIVYGADADEQYLCVFTY